MNSSSGGGGSACSRRRRSGRSRPLRSRLDVSVRASAMREPDTKPRPARNRREDLERAAVIEAEESQDAAQGGLVVGPEIVVDDHEHLLAWEDRVVAAQLLYVVEVVGVATYAPPGANHLLAQDGRAEVLLRL